MIIVTDLPKYGIINFEMMSKRYFLLCLWTHVIFKTNQARMNEALCFISYLRWFEEAHVMLRK